MNEIDAPTPWHVLFVDDDPDYRREVQELDGECLDGYTTPLLIETEASFSQALQRLEQGRYDMVILDIRLDDRNADLFDERAGLRIFEAIKQRRFLPIIFYSAVSHLAQDAISPLVWSVGKTDGTPQLEKVLKDVLDTNLPQINRALIHHVERVQRDYLWDFVAQHWQTLTKQTDQIEVAYLLVRRLALSLSESHLARLVQELGGESGDLDNSSGVHPMRYYVMPPLQDSLIMAGEIFLEQSEGENIYWVLLTPTCDMVQDKAERVLLARCSPLTSREEYLTWVEKGKKERDKTLEPVMRNKHERFWFLPGIGSFGLPGLLIDFQHLESLPCAELERYERVASLDPPFAQELQSRFTRYMGRLGTPDLNTALIMKQLRAEGG